MPVYKIIGFWHDTVSGFGWSNLNHRSEIDVPSAFASFDTWNDFYLSGASNQVVLDGCQVEDVAGGQPTNFRPKAAFTTAIGQVAAVPFPTADGLLYSGYGGPVNKGQVNWLLHGYPRTTALDSNRWNLADATIGFLRTASDAYFRQYRKAVSPVHGWPIINPPAAFPLSNIDAYIRLRRVGRPFLHGGQGLRNR
jgi:hypothetical protein